jgi:hypothetical protein
VADFSKRIAVLALAAAAGCDDSFPPVAGPLDRFYYPVGLAVRRLPASAGFPDGRTALLVVSTNFDLRYDFDVGGAVLAVDPDRSGNALQGDPTLEVLGGLNIGSFGGEVAYLAGTGPLESPDNVCAPLAAADPLVAAGGAKVVVASRGTQQVYRIDMDTQGELACDGCVEAVVQQALDPYDVTATCAAPGGGAVAKVYVTHLRAPGNVGLLTELDLLGGSSSTLLLGAASTFSVTFDRKSGRLFVSSRVGSINQLPMRWFNALTVPPGGEPSVQAHNVAADVRGGLTRQFAIYTDETTTPPRTSGYLRLELFDYDLADRTGSIIPTGGALAVYDLTPNPLGEPAMRLLRVVPTCNGSGQVRVLPPRPGSGALLALTCDYDGTLLFYDDDVGAIVGRIGLDPVTGRPRLGRMPFGLAVEEREAGRCEPGPGYPGPCTRLYVSAFDSSWVSLVEFHVAAPGDAKIVKRIGRERE